MPVLWYTDKVLSVLRVSAPIYITEETMENPHSILKKVFEMCIRDSPLLVDEKADGAHIRAGIQQGAPGGLTVAPGGRSKPSPMGLSLIHI